MPVRTVPRTFVDAVGAAPLTAEVRNAYLGALEDGWGDPSRTHAEGARARAMLTDARDEIAAIIGTSDAHTHFTQSPAVAVQRIVLGIGAARQGRGRAVVSAVESPALTAVARHIARGDVTVTPVDQFARIDIDAFSGALVGGDVACAALQHANREVGTVQPLEDAYAATLFAKVPLVVDATASIGHIAPPRAWDALIADPANWGGPGGIGIMALRPGLRWLPAWGEGAPWAPGTINVPAAVAAATALRLREVVRTAHAELTARLTERLRGIIRELPHTIVLGHPTDRLPHIVAATFVYTDSAVVGRHLDERGFSVGARCSCWGAGDASCPTLSAMSGMTHGTLRFGLHAGLTAPLIDALGADLTRVLADVRARSGAPR